MINFVYTHEARASLALAAGDGEAAEGWAGSAAAYALQTGFSVVRGDAKLRLAGVVAAVGRRREAADGVRDALELFEARQPVPDARRARAMLDELAAVPG